MDVPDDTARMGDFAGASAGASEVEVLLKHARSSAISIRSARTSRDSHKSGLLRLSEIACSRVPSCISLPGMAPSGSLSIGVKEDAAGELLAESHRRRFA